MSSGEGKSSISTSSLLHKQPAPATSEPLSSSMLSGKMTGLFYLNAWFWFNVIITLYCKALFSIYKFPYPLLMTTVHMVFTTLGVNLAALFGAYSPKPLSKAGWKVVSWFSVIFTVNIWMSNASLMAVSVNLHQVVRTTVPLFTMVISFVALRTRYPLKLLPAILIVMFGVACTIKGEVGFDLFGLALTVFGSAIAAIKGIITQQTQVGSLGLSSLDLLRYLCPLAAVQLLCLSWVFGEVGRCLVDPNMSWVLVGHLFILGWVAFFLNFVSFRTAALVAPLTMNIAGNVKQVLTCVLSVYMLGGVMSPTLGVGIITTAIGAFWYSAEMRKWKEQERQKGKMGAGGGAGLMDKKGKSPSAAEKGLASSETEMTMVEKTSASEKEGDYEMGMTNGARRSPLWTEQAPEPTAEKERLMGISKDGQHSPGKGV